MTFTISFFLEFILLLLFFLSYQDLWQQQHLPFGQEYIYYSWQWFISGSLFYRWSWIEYFHKITILKDIDFIETVIKSNDSKSEPLFNISNFALFRNLKVSQVQPIWKVYMMLALLIESLAEGELLYFQEGKRSNVARTPTTYPFNLF